MVLGSPVDSDYGDSRCGCSRVLVCVYNATNLSVDGGGTFDGNGQAGGLVGGLGEFLCRQLSIGDMCV